MVNNLQHQLNACLVEEKTCKKLNELSSNLINTIVVGTHASALPKKTLEEEPYNYVCQGEGPLTIEYLIKFIDKKLKDIKKIRVFGIMRTIIYLLIHQPKCSKI